MLWVDSRAQVVVAPVHFSGLAVALFFVVAEAAFVPVGFFLLPEFGVLSQFLQFAFKQAFRLFQARWLHFSSEQFELSVLHFELVRVDLFFQDFGDFSECWCRCQSGQLFPVLLLLPLFDEGTRKLVQVSLEVLRIDLVFFFLVAHDFDVLWDFFL